VKEGVDGGEERAAGEKDEKTQERKGDGQEEKLKEGTATTRSISTSSSTSSNAMKGKAGAVVLPEKGGEGGEGGGRGPRRRAKSSRGGEQA